MQETNKRRLSKPLKKELIQFFETHSPERFSRHMRGILLDYLHQQADTGLPLHMKDFLWTLHDFFELMDVVSRETKKWKSVDHGESV
jgi:hypothetical protein